MALQKNVKTLANIRFGFMVVYIALFSLYKLVPYKLLIGDKDALLYLAIPIAGLLLLAVDLFYRRNMFKIQYVDSLFLFFVVYACSVIFNYQYELVENVQSLLWMAIQVFLLCGIDDAVDEQLHTKHFRIISDIFIFILSVGAIWSLWQFVVGYGGYTEAMVNEELTWIRSGFIDARLFGIFADPNYACMCSIVAIGLVAFNLKTFRCNVWLKIYYAFIIVMQLLYIILSGSRTGLLILVAVAFVVGVFLTAALIKQKKTVIKIISFTAAGLICAAVSVGCYQGLKAGLAYVPGIYATITNADNPVIDSGTDKDEVDFMDPDKTPNIQQTVDFERNDLADGDNLSNNRFEIWSDCFKLLKKSPLLGTSPKGHLAFAEENFDDLYIVRKQYSVHNGYLALFVGTGIIGGCLMLYWLLRVAIAVLGYLIRRCNTRDKYYWQIFICAMILLAEAISAFPLMALFFCNTITDILFWVVLGYTLFLLRKSEPERYTKRSVVDRIFSRLFVRKRKESEN